MPVSMKPQPPVDPRTEELDKLVQGSWAGKSGPPIGSTWKCAPAFQRPSLKARAAKMRKKYMFGVKV
jgi:hypothetical protein